VAVMTIDELRNRAGGHGCGIPYRVL
jgi:hypothetical protein